MVLDIDRKEEEMSSTLTETRSRPPTSRTTAVAAIAVVATVIAVGWWYIASQTGGPETFPILDDDTVAEANALVAFIEGYEAAWDAGDLEAFAAYLSDGEFEFFEPASHIRSKQGFIDFMRPFFASHTQGNATGRRFFSGDDEVVESYLGWGFGPFTEDNPVVEVDLFTIEDNEITSLHAMYDPAVSRLIYGVDPTDLVTAYGVAWSSGDPDRLLPLYAEDARRTEGLYGIELEGVDQITRHAEAFFTRHPDASWTIVEPYIFTSGILSGAVFVFEEPDGCSIGTAVVTEMDDAGRITDERIYHDIAAIEECGWQR